LISQWFAEDAPVSLTEVRKSFWSAGQDQTKNRKLLSPL